MLEVTIRCRIDEQTRLAANRVFEGLGLSLSTAIRLFLRRVAEDGAIPFEITQNQNKEVAGIAAALQFLIATGKNGKPQITPLSNKDQSGSQGGGLASLVGLGGAANVALDADLLRGLGQLLGSGALSSKDQSMRNDLTQATVGPKTTARSKAISTPVAELKSSPKARSTPKLKSKIKK